MRVESSDRDGAVNSGDEMDLGALRRLFAAKKFWILIPTAAAFALSALAVNVISPRYTAESRIVIEAQENYLPRADKPDGAATSQQLDAEAVGSQVQMLTSRDLARRAIKTLVSQSKSDGFNAASELDPLANGIGPIDQFLVLTGLKRDPTRMSPEDRMLETYFDRLTVLSPTKTRVLSIEFTSRNPEFSARAANTIADLYLDFQREAKRDGARAAAESLAGLVDDLKNRASQADARAEDFRAKSGLLTGNNNTTINTQQLADVNTELAKARTQQADAQARAHLIRDMLRQGRIGDLSEVANNELVRRISEQRVTARSQLALESRTLLPGHPRIRELTAQVADLESEVRNAAERAARGLENDARVAGARVDNLSRALDAQKKVVGSSSSDEVQMREYDRTARSLKDELDAATVKYQDALSRQTSTAVTSDSRIFSRALAPQTASFPKKLPIVAFSTLAALLLSSGLVAAQGFMADPRLSAGARSAPPPARAFSMDSAPSAAHPDVFSALDGSLPRQAGEKTPLPEHAAGAESAPETEPAAIDDIASRIETLGLSAGALILTVPVAEGSDNGLALAIARRLVQSGRVILVASDSMTRTPYSDRPGLANLMDGSATFAEVIHRDHNSRLHVLPEGAGASQAEADLGSVLDALKGTYDFVALGAPGALDLAEAEAVAMRAEVAVVGPGPEKDCDAVAKALEEAGVPHVLKVKSLFASRDRSAA